MTIRYIIRPSSISKTPRILRTALNAVRTQRYPSRNNDYDWSTDFFLSYPHPSVVRNTDDAYRKIYSFSSATKPEQRTILGNLGFRVPWTSTRSDVPVGTGVSSFIVRPLRHSGGQGYRLTQDPTDFIPGSEYIQEVYAKEFEYRVISSFGEPLITLRKCNPNNIAPELPWNHTNGTYFQTISDPFRTCRLANTEIYDLIRSCDLLKKIHLAGIDVMYKSPADYAVCEVNLCPGLTIPENIRKVAEHVRHEFLRQT